MMVVACAEADLPELAVRQIVEIVARRTVCRGPQVFASRAVNHMNGCGARAIGVDVVLVKPSFDITDRVCFEPW